MKYIFIILSGLLLLSTSCTNSDNSNELQTDSTTIVLEDTYSGQMVEYYKNGNKKFDVKYINGEPDGHYLTWFKDGSKKTEGDYEKGKRSGIWKWYNNKGKINFTVIYNNESIASL